MAELTTASTSPAPSMARSRPQNADRSLLIVIFSGQAAYAVLESGSRKVGFSATYPGKTTNKAHTTVTAMDMKRARRPMSLPALVLTDAMASGIATAAQAISPRKYKPERYAETACDENERPRISRRTESCIPATRTDIEQAGHWGSLV